MNRTAVSRADGIVSATIVNRFKAAALIIAAEMTDDGFEVSDAHVYLANVLNEIFR